MASSRALKFVCLVGCIMFMIASTTEVAIQCNQVVNTLSPCMYYVLGTGVLTQQCCNAIVGLNNSVSTTPDRQDLCRCLKNTASQFSFSSRNVAHAAGLPGNAALTFLTRLTPRPTAILCSEADGSKVFGVLSKYDTVLYGNKCLPLLGSLLFSSRGLLCNDGMHKADL